MVKKIMDKLYRIILSGIVDYIDEPKEEITLDDLTKDSILNERKEEITNKVLNSIDESKLANNFVERYFIVNKDFEVTLIQNYGVNRIVEETYDRGIRDVLGVIRTWPTIPPHILLRDIKIAKLLGARAIGSVSRRGAEVHILLMKVKHDWSDCIGIRSDVARKILEKADTLVPVLKEGYEIEDSFDSFSVGDRVLDLYPNVSDNGNWREVMEYMTNKYLGPIEFPQYFFVKLI